MNHSNKRIYPLFIIVILIWGVNWPIMKIGLNYITPLWFCSIRILSGALCLFLLLLHRKKLNFPAKQDFPIICTVGLLQIGLFLSLIHIALTQVNAGQSAILVYTTPIWVAPLAFMLLGEKLSSQTLIGLICGISGVVILLNPWASNIPVSQDFAPNIYLIAASILWAISIIHVRKHTWMASPIELMPFMMLVGGTLLVPTALFYEGLPNIDWTPRLTIVLLYNGPIASAFCYWAYTTISRSLPATTTAISTLGVPIIGFISSAVWLHESINTNKILSFILIISGIIISAFFRTTHNTGTYYK